MYNLILGKTFAAEWSADNLVTDGLVSLSAIGADGSRVAVAEGFKGAFDLVLGRSNAKGGPVILPLHTHALKITHGDYQAPTSFEAIVSIPEIDEIGEISLVLTKKGVPFNERGTWTVNFPVKGTMTLEQIATEIVNRINAGTSSHGLTATLGSVVDEEQQISIVAEESGVDYTIQGADLLSGVDVTVETSGVEGYGTLEQIKRIASKAAADAGFEYTYLDGAALLYPEYPLNPLKGEDSEDEGYSVITIRCGEPRATKTTDEIVHQTIFVVFPTSAAEESHVVNFVNALKAVGALVSQNNLNAGGSSSAASSSAAASSDAAE